MDELDDLARRGGIDPRRLLRLRKAWQVGGEDAVGAAVSRGGRDWRTDPNGRVQLRRGSEGAWYPFEPDGDGWIVSGPPVADPSLLLDPVARRVPFWRRGMTEKERRAYMFGGGWFQDLQTMHVASPLRLLVVAEMTEMADGDGLLRGMRVGELAERCREAAIRTPVLAGEAADVMHDPVAWNRIWRPYLTAWSRARRGSPRWFRVAADQIEPLLPVAPGCEREFTGMTRDIVLDRLHAITII